MQGWGRPAPSPERAASSTLEHSCGADSEFPPHVVERRGRGTAAGLFPWTEHSLVPGAPSRLQMPRLSHFPPTPEVAELIIPIFDMSKPKLPKAGTCSRSHIRTLDSKSPIGRGIGASQPPASPFPVSGHSPRGPCPRPDSPTLALIPQGISEQRSKEVQKQSTQRTG